MRYDINVQWDDEAGVWCAKNDEIPIALESNSFDALVVKVKVAAREILELNNMPNENIQLCFNAAHVEYI